jgi:DNA-binding HxlR family transcriptional regulator
MNAAITHYGADIFGRKWRVIILHSLKDGPMRFSQIKAGLPDCSVKVLSESLQQLEYHRIILRKQYNTIPVKVTYELSGHVMNYVYLIADYIKFLKGHIYINQDVYEISPEVAEYLHEAIQDEAQGE